MGNLFRQLQRRNVIKAAISYVVISWAFLQAADIIFPILNISDEVLRFILIVLVVLFPFWIVFAYFFEWTEQGFRLTSRVEEKASISETTSRRLNTYIIGGLSIAVILLLTDRFTNFTGVLASASNERSIAVLPFDNLGDPETAYFAEGMAEDILTQLSKVANLRVLSRVTLRGYDMSGKTVEEIGEELGVSFLLTGSIRKANEQVRVSCQLVQVNPEEQTWAESFDRQLIDIFQIQSDVAQNIATRLQANLSPEEKQRIETAPTQNLEAYTLYLKGRQEYNKHRSQDMLTALDLFKEAIELDPNLALAYAGLADTYGQLVFSGLLPNNYFDTALVAGEKSVALNAELAEGWKALGLVNHYSSNYKQAQECYERALLYNPNYHPAVVNLVGIYGVQGKLSKAMKTAARSLKLDPLNGFSYGMVGRGLSFIGMNDSAEFIMNRGVEIDPSYLDGFNILADVYIDQGRTEEAMQALEKVTSGESAGRYSINSASKAMRFDTSAVKYFLAKVPDLEQNLIEKYQDAYSIVAHLVNDPDSSRQLIKSGIEYYERLIASGRSPVNAHEELAMLFSMNHQKEAAFEQMEKMIETGFMHSPILQDDPRFANLRGEPTFDSLYQVVEKKRERMRMELSGKLIDF